MSDKETIHLPMVIGATYYLKEFPDTLAILESADYTEDFYRLKCISTPWIFEGTLRMIDHHWLLKTIL